MMMMMNEVGVGNRTGSVYTVGEEGGGEIFFFIA